MNKTLRQMLFWAFLAGFLVVFTPVGDVRADEIEEFLKSPGVIEQFKNAKGTKGKRNENQQSPLVIQAEKFALYLNPPAPKPKTSSRRSPKPSTSRKPAKVSAKFDLKGTSFYVSDPKLSLALIDEPGKGLRWVRQSSKVGHLIIEQIKDGIVVVRDGATTFELEVPKKQKTSLLKGSSDEKTSKAKPTDPKTELESVLERKDACAAADEADYLGEEETALMNQFMEKIRSGTGSDKISSQDGSDDKTAMMENLISQLQAMRVSREESENLQSLGKELEQLRKEANEPNSKPTKPKPRPRRPRTRRLRK